MSQPVSGSRNVGCVGRPQPRGPCVEVGGGRCSPEAPHPRRAQAQRPVQHRVGPAVLPPERDDVRPRRAPLVLAGHAPPMGTLDEAVTVEVPSLASLSSARVIARLVASNHASDVIASRRPKPYSASAPEHQVLVLDDEVAAADVLPDPYPGAPDSQREIDRSRNPTGSMPSAAGAPDLGAAIAATTSPSGFERPGAVHRGAVVREGGGVGAERQRRHQVPIQGTCARPGACRAR